MERALTERFGVSCDLGQILRLGRTPADTWITTEVLRHSGLPETPENVHDYLEANLQTLPLELKAGKQGSVLPGVLQIALELLHLTAPTSPKGC